MKKRSILSFLILGLALTATTAFAQSGEDATLFEGLEKNNVKKIEKSLERGANPNALSPTGNTPIHYAIMHNSTKAIKALAKHGADIHFMNNAGNTPLMAAALQGSEDSVALLIDLGTDL